MQNFKKILVSSIILFLGCGPFIAYAGTSGITVTTPVPVTTNTATIAGNVTGFDAANFTQIWIDYGTTAAMTSQVITSLQNVAYDSNVNNFVGTFTKQITGLTPSAGGTVYFYKAKAGITGQPFTQGQFTTTPTGGSGGNGGVGGSNTSSITEDAASITQSSAIISGIVTDNAINVGTVVYVTTEYSLVSDFNPKQTVQMSATATVAKKVNYSQPIVGLASAPNTGTLYYYKTYYKLDVLGSVIATTTAKSFTTTANANGGVGGNANGNDTNNGTTTGGQEVVPTNNPGSAEGIITGGCVGQTEEGAGEYCLLEPLPIPTNTGSSETLNKYTPTTFKDYVNTIFKIAIGIISVLAVLMIVIGGVQYMSTDAIGGKENGKETVGKALFGLFIGLGAYILLYTLNPQLVSLNFGIEQISCALDTAHPLDQTQYTQINNVFKLDSNGNKIPCFQQSTGFDFPQDAITVTYTNASGQTVSGTHVCPTQFPNAQGPNWTQTIAGQVIKFISGQPWPSDSAELAQLTTNGIVTNYPGQTCTTLGQQGCTSLWDMPSASIAKMKTIKDQCIAFNGGGAAAAAKCQITVTGGTECWEHTSHGPGIAPFDIRNTSTDTTGLVNYVKHVAGGADNTAHTCIIWIPNEHTGGCTTNGQAMEWTRDSIKFVDEGDHYHVK